MTPPRGIGADDYKAKACAPSPITHDDADASNATVKQTNCCMCVRRQKYTISTYTHSWTRIMPKACVCMPVVECAQNLFGRLVPLNQWASFGCCQQQTIQNTHIHTYINLIRLGTPLVGSFVMGRERQYYINTAHEDTLAIAIKIRFTCPPSTANNNTERI